MTTTKPAVILGVDPGLKGALAFWHTEAELLETFPMPTLRVMRNGTERGEIDIYALAHLIRDRALVLRKAYIERVGSMPNQGAASGFTFGKVTGIVIGCVAAHLVSVDEPSPAVWKRAMGVTADKDTSRRMASKLMPQFAQQWSPGAHGIGDKESLAGLAEAALLARYGAMQK